MALSRVESVKRTKFNRLDLIRRYKESVGCACGERRTVCLDLHHRDREQKNPKLSIIAKTGRRYAGGGRWRDLSYEELVAEIRKCDVVCANCHRIATSEDLGWLDYGEQVVRERHSPGLAAAEVALGLAGVAA